MNILKLTGGAAAMIATMGLAVPAEAQRFRGGDRGHHGKRHHRGGDRVDAGGLILGAVLLGGLLALGDSEKKRRARAEAYEADYDASAPESGSPVADMPAPNAAEYDGLYDVEAAGDRCAAEAETLAQNYARLTRVSSIGSTTWSFGKWIVKGKIQLADNENDSAPRTHNFRCSLKAGSEPQVTFEGL
ncbi:MAG: hypothetical protein EOP60_01110 [Sphingomonadales bacterium]|nr:MAG: hypothetical protein EOP60_01110 [Sphingomonadales bacterium]